ncbi:MAG: ATP-binding cassette domain-containing protein, partial [Anaerovoracaceae bacterium]|nr:ATP-binding cassette domain-containing protein [Anaerovoracaceae bacterium]
KVINIDQSPIGRTPRSNPATYTGVFTYIRQLFAEMNESKIRGYKPGRFSFNVKGGRCEACKGDGIIKIEMNFLSDVYVPCEVCHGKRYNRETLEVRYRGKNIAEVLDMTISEALEYFKNIPRITRKLETLEQVGLGYVKLGQPSTQLSGGEAQRIKLAAELSKRGTGNTLYILDEPTTGLHFADVDKLLTVLDSLVDQGNTVVVIEHNLDVVKRADHIIDLGPDGGDRGGGIVAEGTPEEVAEVKESYTGQYLKKILK